MQPDLYEISVSAGDRLLLCSDGLTTMLNDNAIEHILKRTHDPQRAASMLVNEAIAAGGHDNVTVVVVDIEGNAEERVRKASFRGRLGAILIAILLVLTVCGVIGGVYNYAQGRAYLKAENGYVAVYKGVNEEVFGRNLSTLDHVTSVRIQDLTPTAASRLESGVIPCDSVEAANKLIADYEAQIKEESANSASQSSGTSVSSGSSTSSSTSHSGTAGGSA